MDMKFDVSRFQWCPRHPGANCGYMPKSRVCLVGPTQLTSAQVLMSPPAWRPRPQIDPWSRGPKVPQSPGKAHSGLGITCQTWAFQPSDLPTLRPPNDHDRRNSTLAGQLGRNSDSRQFSSFWTPLTASRKPDRSPRVAQPEHLEPGAPASQRPCHDRLLRRVAELCRRKCASTPMAQ